MLAHREGGKPFLDLTETHNRVVTTGHKALMPLLFIYNEALERVERAL